MTPGPDWIEFDGKALERARVADQPLLMLITVPWCRYCRELLATTFADPGVVEQVGAEFVPVLVDAERRPDVNERYGAGGWPTIAFLTPTGELIANEHYLSAAQLCARMDKVRSWWRDHRNEIQQGIQNLIKARSEARDTRGRLQRQMVEDISLAICDKFDHKFGGWGEGSKFPHPEAIDFALVQVSKRGDARMREVATVTLDHMVGSPLHDSVEGGFFRYSKTPDWRTPNHEKLLDANARTLRCLLESFQLFGNPAHRRAAEGIVMWLRTAMLDPDTGCFFGSQEAPSDYFHKDREGRKHLPPPAVDRTIYTNANAMAISSLLKAAVILDQPDWKREALAALNFLLENLFDGREVYHYWDGTYHLPGMLGDQAHMIRALIDCSQHTGNADLLLPAERIAEQVIARQKAPGGGFFDILHDTRLQGQMSRRNRSILENSVMAESLVRLSYLSRRSNFHDEAMAALEAFANDYKEYGYHVAGYGRAVDLVFYEPLFITILGPRDDAATQALRHTALLPYLPSRMVQTLDPVLDPVLIGRGGYDLSRLPAVHLTVGKTTRSVVYTQEELTEAMERIERQRRASC